MRGPCVDPSSLPFLLSRCCGAVLCVDSGRFFSRVAVSKKRRTNKQTNTLLLLLRITNCLLKIRIGFLSTLLEEERKGKEYRWREWMVNETCLCTKSKSLLTCVRYPPIGYHRLQLFSPRIRQTGRQSGWSFLNSGRDGSSCLSLRLLLFCFFICFLSPCAAFISISP